MSRKGSGLASDPFHHASVSAKGVDVKVEKTVEARAVVTRSQPLPGHGNANAGGDALAERSSRRLYARCPAVLRVPRAASIHLAKWLNRIQCNRRFAENLVVL